MIEFLPRRTARRGIPPAPKPPQEKADDTGEAAVLLRIAKDLEQLRADAEAIGQHLLASLLEFSKAEANDAFNTAAADARFATELNRSALRGSEIITREAG
jgi:hypothetical protein